MFGSGRYAPGHAAGRKLLAHEMAHVVQQAGGNSFLQARAEPGVNQADNDAEREAEQAAARLE